MSAFVGCPVGAILQGRRKRPKFTALSIRSSMNLDAQPASKSLFDALQKPIRVALTREEGKNLALHNSLRVIYPTIEIVHTPCVETVSAEHTELLPEKLQTTTFGWIVITSPEAASTFIKAWKKANFPDLGKVAAVGKATAEILRAVGFQINFLPSRATGKSLFDEFPEMVQPQETVLYPSSARASNVVVDGLSARGYTVIRLNSYSTEQTTFNEEMRWLAEGAHIVTFASPSAVSGWVENMGVKNDVAAACIGITSAKAAKEAGFQYVHFPENPGMDGWLTTISDAMKLHDKQNE